VTLYIRRTSGVTSAIVPDAPAAPTLTAGVTQLSAAWAAPGSDGGSVITSYDLRHSVAAAASWTTVTGVTSPRTVTGLTNGTSYDIQIRAVNAVGNGAWSTSSTGTPAAAGNLNVRSWTSSTAPYGTSMTVPAGAVATNTLIFFASFGSDVSAGTAYAPALSSTIPGFPTAGVATGNTVWRGWWIGSWNGSTTSYNFGDESWAGERIIICLTGTASDVIGGEIRTVAAAALAWTAFTMTANDVAIALGSGYDPADGAVTSFDSTFTKMMDQGATEWCGMTAWYKRLTAGESVSPNPTGTAGFGNHSTQLIRVRP